MAWKPHNANIVAKVLTAKLGSDPGVPAEFEHFFFKVGVAKSVSEG